MVKIAWKLELQPSLNHTTLNQYLVHTQTGPNRAVEILKTNLVRDLKWLGNTNWAESNRRGEDLLDK